MDGPLRPRDIQSRIRAGESAEALAEAAGTDVERVMVYARPVLAERAHIAERAQRASLRVRHSDMSPRLLGDVVADRLRAQNISPDSVTWDAWRREDGRWTLVTESPLGDGTAEFLFDAAGRYVLPDNDIARRLVGDEPEPAAPAATSAVAPEGSPGPTRVEAAPELPLGEDALGIVREPEPQPPKTPADDWMATQASEPVTAASRAGSVAGSDQDDEVTEPVVEQDEAGAGAEEDEPPARKGRRHRASVPSWDEIMFGSGPQE